MNKIIDIFVGCVVCFVLFWVVIIHAIFEGLVEKLDDTIAYWRLRRFVKSRKLLTK